MSAIIQLYIIGVFVSFTLSQAGMVTHWNRRLPRAYDRTERRRMHRSRAVNVTGETFTGIVLVVVLVSKTHAPTLQAIGYGRSIHPHSVTALTVSVDPAETAALRREWHAHEMRVPLIVLDSPYREISRPVLDYVRRLRREGPRDVITVFIPECVLGHWWGQILHNQSALRLKTRLRFTPGVMVTTVSYLLDSAQTQPPDASSDK